jgi:hypothetical protein
VKVGEIHLAGAYGIDEILDYNRSRQESGWNFPTFFRFWEACPGAELAKVGQKPPAREATLLVINQNQTAWESVRELLPTYGRTVLLQMEAFLGWEIAYQECDRYSNFLSFDPTYAWHPGYIHFNIPYEKSQASSHRDRRGLPAMNTQWRYSRRDFLSIYLLSFLPRKKKAVMIATLHPQERYQNRLRMAERWVDVVDVYGGGWPKSLPSYRGLAASKIDLMKRYRYCLVFENQRQPGYVTEKLLDCFIAGSVPLYWGAPGELENGAEAALIRVDDEDVPISSFLQDQAGYQRHRSALLESKERVLDRYSIAGFTAALRTALSGDSSDYSM